MSIEVVFKGPVKSGKRALAEVLSRMLNSLDVEVAMDDSTTHEDKTTPEALAVVARKLAESGPVTFSFEKSEE